MDRAGKVIDYLDHLLPNGTILDVGAGNGFTAQKLTHFQRKIVALEPAGGMIDRQVSLPWAQGVAQELPFKANSFSGAYATWAYFFPTYNEYGTLGLKEIHRVVMPDHPLVIVDNAGGDEFCSLFERDLSSDSSWWQAQGFERHIVNTHFHFDSFGEAEELLSFYWNHNGRTAGHKIKLKYEYRVAVYRRNSVDQLF
jgi:SAM-dependent methyltransferase